MYKLSPGVQRIVSVIDQWTQELAFWMIIEMNYRFSFYTYL